MDIRKGRERLKDIFLNDNARDSLIQLDSDDIDNFLTNSKEISINTYTHEEIISKKLQIPNFEVMGAIIMVEGTRETALNETVQVAGSVRDYIKDNTDDVMFAFSIVEGEGEANIKKVHVAFSDGRFKEQEPLSLSSENASKEKESPRVFHREKPKTKIIESGEEDIKCEESRRIIEMLDRYLEL